MKGQIPRGDVRENYKDEIEVRRVALLALDEVGGGENPCSRVSGGRRRSATA